MVAARISIALIACATTASASPIDDPTAGRAVFTGATMPAASSIVMDPAALGLGTIDEIYTGLTTTIDQLSIDRSSLDLATGSLRPAGSIHDVVLGPGADLAYIGHPSPRIAIGVQLRTPPAQVFAQGHPELSYYTLGGYQRDIQASGAASLRVADFMLVGFSITIDDTLLRLRFARDTALERGSAGLQSDCGGGMPCGVENPNAAETYDVKVRQPLDGVFSDGYIVNLGVMVQLWRDAWLAVAYHTPPGGATSIHNTLTGSVDVTRAPRDGGDVLHGGATVYESLPATVDVEFRARLQSHLDLHVGGRWQDLSRDAGWDVRVYGSTFPKANIPEWIERPRGFHDVFAMWAGVEQDATTEPRRFLDRLRFGGRIGFETSALDDDRTTALTIAPRSATLDGGVQMRFNTVVVQLSYGLQYFPTVGVAESAFDPRDRVACVDGGFDYATTACANVRAGYAIPTAAGDYRRIEHSIRLGIRFEIP